MPRKIICIYTESTVPTRYVTNTYNRFGKHSVGVELTDNPTLAHDFGTRPAAQAVIDRIHNPWERTWEIKEMIVTQPAPIAEVLRDYEALK